MNKPNSEIRMWLQSTCAMIVFASVCMVVYVVVIVVLQHLLGGIVLEVLALPGMWFACDLLGAGDEGEVLTASSAFSLVLGLFIGYAYAKSSR